MPLSVVTPAPTRRLTRKEHVTAEIGVADPILLDRLIDAASAAIENLCGVVFARESVTELVPGFGDTRLQLQRRPIVAVTAVVFDGEVITDYSIDDREEGTLYRRAGWAWTAQVAPGLTGPQRWPGFGSPLPNSEEARFSVSHVSGYILPEQDLESVRTVSAALADNSFNDLANGFPALLKAGDLIEVAGFQLAPNNGRFLVTGTPTASKIQVSATLATEPVGEFLTHLKFRAHADCRRRFDDVEKACIETVKSWWLERAKDPGVAEKQVGSLRIRYGDVALPVPAICVGLLRPWMSARAA